MLVTEQHTNQNSVWGPGHLNNLTHTGRSVLEIQTPLRSYPKSLHLSTLRPGLLLKPFAPLPSLKIGIIGEGLSAGVAKRESWLFI